MAPAPQPESAAERLAELAHTYVTLYKGFDASRDPLAAEHSGLFSRQTLDMSIGWIDIPTPRRCYTASCITTPR